MLGLAALGIAETFDAPAGAQVADGATTPVTPRTLVSVDRTNSSDRALSASDDGRVVALDTAKGATSALAGIDRVAGKPIAELPADGAHPTVSGNGCIIAYSVVDPSGTNVNLHALDRCSTPAATLDLDSLGGSAPLPAPAVSADGGVIVWSTGDALVRFHRPSAAYVRDTAFAADAGADRTFGDHLDIAVTASGEVLVYETVGQPTQADPAPTSVHILDSSGVATPVAVSGARIPSISADGTLVAYERYDAAQSTSAVEVYDRTDPAAPVTRPAAADSWNPALSADGHHVVYERADGVHVTWWSDGDPFVSTSAVKVLDTISNGDAAPTDSGPGPTISASGRVILAVGDQSVAAVSPPLPTGSYVWQHVREGSATAQTPVDLGSVTVGQVATGTVRFTNAGQVGIPLERIDAAGATKRFAPVGDANVKVTGWSCGTAAVWQPGTVCVADVSMTPSAAGARSGTVRLDVPANPETGAAAVSASATVKVAGIAPSTTSTTTTTTTTTSTTTSTTVPPSTTPPNTLPIGTVPTRPSAYPLPSDPIFTGGGYYPSSSSGSSSSSDSSSASSSGSTTSATTTTTVPELPTFEPPNFEFAPTIIDVGRRTTEVALFNPGPDSVSVTALAIDPSADSFVLGTTDCEGTSLAAQGRCTIEVAFAPTTVGALEATLTATFDDGRQATATLTGLGADSPVLTVEPEVATDGQVVSVFGAGFPTGSTIELSWDDGRSTSEHTVTDIGDFSETLIVLPHTPRGPSELLVSGQDDLFADVTAELLIDVTARRADSAVFGQLGR